MDPGRGWTVTIVGFWTGVLGAVLEWNGREWAEEDEGGDAAEDVVALCM